MQEIDLIDVFVNVECKGSFRNGLCSPGTSLWNVTILFYCCCCGTYSNLSCFSGNTGIFCILDFTSIADLTLKVSSLVHQFIYFLTFIWIISMKYWAPDSPAEKYMSFSNIFLTFSKLHLTITICIHKTFSSIKRSYKFGEWLIK